MTSKRRSSSRSASEQTVLASPQCSADAAGAGHRPVTDQGGSPCTTTRHDPRCRLGGVRLLPIRSVFGNGGGAMATLRTTHNLLMAGVSSDSLGSCRLSSEYFP
jgi:hypothetical protein